MEISIIAKKDNITVFQEKPGGIPKVSAKDVKINYIDLSGGTNDETCYIVFANALATAVRALYPDSTEEEFKKHYQKSAKYIHGQLEYQIKTLWVQE